MFQTFLLLTTSSMSDQEEESRVRRNGHRRNHRAEQQAAAEQAQQQQQQPINTAPVVPIQQPQQSSNVINNNNVPALLPHTSTAQQFSNPRPYLPATLSSVTATPIQHPRQSFAMNIARNKQHQLPPHLQTPTVPITTTTGPPPLIPRASSLPPLPVTHHQQQGGPAQQSQPLQHSTQPPPVDSTSADTSTPSEPGTEQAEVFLKPHEMVQAFSHGFPLHLAAQRYTRNLLAQRRHAREMNKRSQWDYEETTFFATNNISFAHIATNPRFRAQYIMIQQEMERRQNYDRNYQQCVQPLRVQPTEQMKTQCSQISSSSDTNTTRQNTINQAAIDYTPPPKRIITMLKIHPHITELLRQTIKFKQPGDPHVRVEHLLHDEETGYVGIMESVNFNIMATIPICARNITAANFLLYGVPLLTAHLVNVFELCPRCWVHGCTSCKDPLFIDGQLVRYGTPNTEDLVIDETGHFDNLYIDVVANLMLDPAFYRADYQIPPNYPRTRNLDKFIAKQVMRSPLLKSMITIPCPHGQLLISTPLQQMDESEPDADTPPRLTSQDINPFENNPDIAQYINNLCANGWIGTVMTRVAIFRERGLVPLRDQYLNAPFVPPVIPITTRTTTTTAPASYIPNAVNIAAADVTQEAEDEAFATTIQQQQATTQPYDDFTTRHPETSTSNLQVLLQSVYKSFAVRPFLVPTLTIFQFLEINQSPFNMHMMCRRFMDGPYTRIGNTVMFYGPAMFPDPTPEEQSSYTPQHLDLAQKSIQIPKETLTTDVFNILRTEAMQALKSEKLPAWYTAGIPQFMLYLNLIGVFHQDQLASIFLLGVNTTVPDVAPQSDQQKLNRLFKYQVCTAAKIMRPWSVQPVTFSYAPADPAYAPSDWQNPPPVECSDGTRIAFNQQKDRFLQMCRTCNQSAHTDAVCPVNSVNIPLPAYGVMISPGFSLEKNINNDYVWRDNIFDYVLEPGQAWIRPLYTQEDVPRVQYTDEDGELLPTMRDCFTSCFNPNSPRIYRMPQMNLPTPQHAQVPEIRDYSAECAMSAPSTSSFQQ